MADIELVIKIDENIYRRLKSGNYGLLVSNTCAYEVLNGTPLPKGHERLIDADKFTSEHFGKVARLVDDAPTIIEADKEEEE